MENQINKLRTWIDGLFTLVASLTSITVPSGTEGHTRKVMSREMENCYNELRLSKAFLGKHLGEMKKEEGFLDIEAIAKSCHEANRSYCESIGDTSQLPWDEAADWQKESAIAGVKFFLDNPNVTPEMQHMAWSESKTADGWKYGEVKDAEAKTHPCLVSYNELPEAQKEKDVIFQRTIRSFMTPYANEGTRKTVSDIEPTAQKSDAEIFEEEKVDEMNYIEKIDFLRKHIGIVSDRIMKIKEGKFTIKSNIYLTQAFIHSDTARLMLGFELERLKNESHI